MVGIAKSLIKSANRTVVSFDIKFIIAGSHTNSAVSAPAYPARLNNSIITHCWLGWEHSKWKWRRLAWHKVIILFLISWLLSQPGPTVPWSVRVKREILSALLTRSMFRQGGLLSLFLEYRVFSNHSQMGWSKLSAWYFGKDSIDCVVNFTGTRGYRSSQVPLACFALSSTISRFETACFKGNNVRIHVVDSWWYL